MPDPNLLAGETTEDVAIADIQPDDTILFEGRLIVVANHGDHLLARQLETHELERVDGERFLRVRVGP